MPRMNLKILCSSITVLFFLVAFSTVKGSAQIQSNTSAERASYDLIRRVLPYYYTHFTVKIIPAENGKDVFGLENENGKIVIEGNNGVSVASGLYYYLKNFAHCQVTWDGVNTNLPAALPKVHGKIRKNTSYDFRYYLNYCTFSYSMCWWDWKRWEKEIDWMALHGINMPLALTGENATWYRVYKQLGFSDKDLSSFFPGPTYFAWFWMGNLDGWGGPLSASFMKGQEALDKKILARERSLGMIPVLPAFTGHVPPAFKEHYPEATLKEITWGGKYHTWLLNPDDPLFKRIGRLFLRDEIRTYGTSHYYSADVFNENTPPTNDSVYLNNVSRGVYESMASVDDKATWIMQGWLFVNNPTFWQPPQIKAVLNSVPDKKLIILDLWSETRPVWSRTNAYYGKPWIWCMLLNFGGNVGMFGRMDVIAAEPYKTLKSRLAGYMTGLGLTPEGIEQNPVMYELMTDNIWRTDTIDLNQWLKGYILQRYGKSIPRIYDAWEILRETVYRGGTAEGAPESIFTGRPTFNKDSRWTKTALNYAPGDLLPAWKYFIISADQVNHSDGFQYDLVDLTRQVLANYADTLQQKITSDYNNKNETAFKKDTKAFLSLMDDLNRLLGTRKEFLLGRWILSAIQMGKSAPEKRQFEKDAKDQITLWGDKNASLHEYACKQWSGLISSFYKPRWQQFFQYADSCLKENKPFDEQLFDNRMKDWEWSWVNRQESFADTPSGNPVQIAKELYHKYSFLSNLYK